MKKESSLNQTSSTLGAANKSLENAIINVKVETTPGGGFAVSNNIPPPYSHLKNDSKISENIPSEGAAPKAKSKLAKMILNVLDDEGPTPEEAERQRQEALKYSLELAAEAERKKKLQKKTKKK